jgi:flagellar basal-body rod protein FlgB
LAWFLQCFIYKIYHDEGQDKRMLDNIGLMRGINGKMNWLNQRQVTISSNIANADTPGFRPSDLQEVDFGKVMKGATGRPSLSQAVTNSNHIGGQPRLAEADAREMKQVYESAPDDNAVIMEEQLFKAQQTMADYNMITNLYRKNVGMIRMVVTD